MGDDRLRLLSYMAPGFPRSLFERVAEALGSDLAFDETGSGPGAGIDPFAAGEADFGWICSTSYVDLVTRGIDPSVRLVGVGWVPSDPGSRGRPVYFADLVVRPESAIVDFGDVRGRTVGCNDEVSLSGHHAFRFEVRRRGLDAADFAELHFTGGHHLSLDQLVSGELDAAVVDSVVRAARATADPAVADLRVVARLGPWPVQPLVVRTDLADEVVDAARTALLAANDDPRMQAELRAAGLARFAPVTQAHYEPVRTAMTRIRSLTRDSRGPRS